MSASVIFGGRSPIALACAQLASERQKTYLVTRQIRDDLVIQTKDFPEVELVEADLSKPGAAARVLSDIYAQEEEVDSIVFLQRYRPISHKSFSEHCNIELWGIVDALETVRLSKKRESIVNIVVSTSPAASVVLDDQDVSYHIVKSGQESIVRYYSTKLLKDRILINGIRIGSVVIKDRAQSYWDSIPDVQEGLTSLLPRKKLLTSADIAEGICFIALNANRLISGQILNLDGGSSLLDSIQVGKTILEERRVVVKDERDQGVENIKTGLSK